MTKSITERMADVNSAPSLVPQDRPAPTPKAEEPPPPPQLADLVKDKKDFILLAKLIKSDMGWKETEAEAKKVRRGMEEKIKTLLGRHGIVGSALLDDIRVSYHESERSTLNVNLLLSHGVSPATILACTDKKLFHTLRLSVKGERSDDGGED
jgi:hypothetical protein